MPTICEEDGCETRANFNNPGEKTGLYCKRHKKQGMVDVKNLKCEISGCSKRPNYNKNNEKKPIRCFDHKMDDMVDVVHPHCKEKDCYVRPSFGMLSKKAEYCLIHKKEGMVNVVDPTCEELSCRKRPNFNIEGESLGRYCTEHKKEGMVDVTHRRCDNPGCDLQPGHTEPISGKKYCSNHKTIDCITKIRKCESPGCETIPTFAPQGEKSALRCAPHRKDDDVDIKHKFCKTPRCGIRAIDKYKGYCMRCHVHIHPDLPNSRNYKTKESAVSKFIKESFPDVSFISDKQIVDGCSKRRPDEIADFGTHCIIIETDEKKHNSYECSCENKRIMEISSDIGHRPIVFLRFNPDAYIDDKENKITSCWGVDGRGMAVVKKEKKDEWEKRLSALHTQLLYWIHNIPGKTVEIIQLFYDQPISRLV